MENIFFSAHNTLLIWHSKLKMNGTGGLVKEHKFLLTKQKVAGKFHYIYYNYDCI